MTEQQAQPEQHGKRLIPFAHPVEETVRVGIMQALADIEREHEVTVLFACESGSRGWGFASPDSDYDVRFVHVPRLAWYLRVDVGRDVIELPISAALDVSGWELRKTLGLLRASNPVLLEWLDSPIVYRQEAEAVAELRALAQQAFSRARAWHHYYSMAKKTWHSHLQRDEIKLKKYLYALRPLLAARWVLAHDAVPPMRFVDLAEAMLDRQKDAALLGEISSLLEVKMQADETLTGAQRPLFTQFIQAELQRMERAPPQAPRQDGLLTACLDAFLCRTVQAFDASGHHLA